MIKIEISREDFMRHVKDGSYDTSICFDSTGFPLDDYLESFFLQIQNGRVYLEWGGMEYFIKWRNPFKPFKFSFEEIEYLFFLSGSSEQDIEKAIHSNAILPNDD